MDAVRVGRKAAGRRLVVHLAIDGRVCRSDIDIHVDVTCESATTRLCKNCWTPARIAAARQLVDAAREANIKRASCPARYAEENVLNALFGWFLTDEERAVEAELLARWSKPIAVVEEPKRTAFAEAAERMGAKPRQLPTNVTPISTRRRLALANSFAA